MGASTCSLRQLLQSWMGQLEFEKKGQEIKARKGELEELKG